MAGTLSVVPMVPEDLPTLAALEEACFSTPWSRDALAAELGKKEAIFLVARLDGEIAGYAGMNFVLDEGYLDNVAVFPAFRRRGVARALISRLISQSRALGLAFLTLEVRPSNAGAIALYQSLGFREAGRRRNYYTHPPEDALLLTLWLGEPSLPGV